jgi:hypothetical protein
MMKCFKDSQNRLIDLYFNDVHCLTGSINCLKNDEFSFIRSYHVKMPNMTAEILVIAIKGELVNKCLIFDTYEPLLPQSLLLELSHQDLVEVQYFKKMLKYLDID